MTDSSAGLAALYARLQDDSTGKQHVPPHVLHRAGVLLGGDDPLYVDSDIAVADDGSCTGRLVALTLDRVVVVDVDRALDRPRHGATSVRAVTFLRRSLEQLAITEEDGGDADWSGLSADTWPGGRTLTLGYRDQPPLRLPLNRDPGDPVRFARLVPRLLKDLQAS